MLLLMAARIAATSARKVTLSTGTWTCDTHNRTKTQSDKDEAEDERNDE